MVKIIIRPLSGQIVEINCDYQENVLIENIKLIYSEKISAPTNYIDRLICDSKLLCPKQPITSLNLDENGEIKMYSLFALGVGLNPPSTLINSVEYKTETKSLKSCINYSDMCGSTRHQHRSVQNCQYCGLPKYKKPLFDDILIENDKLQSINFKFNRFSYPNKPDVFTLKLNELSNFISVSDEDNNQLLEGSIQMATNVDSTNPTIKWSPKKEFGKGEYLVSLRENEFPHDGNFPSTLGLTEFRFLII